MKVSQLGKTCYIYVTSIYEHIKNGQNLNFYERLYFDHDSELDCFHANSYWPAADDDPKLSHIDLYEYC